MRITSSYCPPLHILCALVLLVGLGLVGCRSGGNARERPVAVSPNLTSTPVPTLVVTPTPPSVLVPAERAALVALYQATGGPNWAQWGRIHWQSNRPLDVWSGVTTNAEGRVTGLKLRGVGLRGVLPSELGELSALKSLDLASNQLSGGIPPELGRLAALESLDLSDNRLTDPLPPQLGRLSSLNALNLENNLFQGAIPPELGALPLFTHLLYGSRSFSAENLGLRIGGNLWTGCLPPAWSELGLYALIGLDLDFCIEGREFQPPLLSSSRQVNVGEEEEPGEAHSCWAAAALAPALKMAGDYDNLAKDLEGHYELALTGARVAATFTTKRSPIPPWSKRPTPPLFILPESFRPPFPILRTSVGKPVEAEGDQPLPGLIYLQVNPDGTVHHLARPSVEGVGSWSYRLQTGWGTTPPAADRWAIETVYAALKGNAWLRQQPWSCPGQPLENWPGVATNAAGRVVQLDLRNHGLQGALPSELGDLTALRTLDLSNNNLEGPLPVSLGQLARANAKSRDGGESGSCGAGSGCCPRANGTEQIHRSLGTIRHG